MEITVTCSCGKRHSVDDKLSGTRCMCPACGAMFTFPRPQDSSRDEVIEQDFSVAGELTPEATSTTVAVPALATPCMVPPGGLPGDLLCPFCNRALNTVTVAEVGPHMKSWWWRYLLCGNWFISYFINLGLPLSCRDCGPIHYRKLIGESRKTVDKLIREYRLRFLKTILVVLLFIGIVASLPFLLHWLRDWRYESRLSHSNDQRQEMNERALKMKQEVDQRVKQLNDEHQRMQEERDRIYNNRPRPHDAPPPLTPEMKAKIAPLGSPDAKPIHKEPKIFDK